MELTKRIADDLWKENRELKRKLAEMEQAYIKAANKLLMVRRAIDADQTSNKDQQTG